MGRRQASQIKGDPTVRSVPSVSPPPLSGGASPTLRSPPPTERPAATGAAAPQLSAQALLPAFLPEARGSAGAPSGLSTGQPAAFPPPWLAASLPQAPQSRGAAASSARGASARAAASPPAPRSGRAAPPLWSPGAGRPAAERRSASLPAADSSAAVAGAWQFPANRAPSPSPTSPPMPLGERVAASPASPASGAPWQAVLAGAPREQRRSQSQPCQDMPGVGWAKNLGVLKRAPAPAAELFSSLRAPSPTAGSSAAEIRSSAPEEARDDEAAVCGSYVDNWRSAFLVDQDGSAVTFLYEGQRMDGQLSGTSLSIDGMSPGTVERGGDVAFADGGWWKLVARSKPSQPSPGQPAQPREPAVSAKPPTPPKKPSVLNNKVMHAIGAVTEEDCKAMRVNRLVASIEELVNTVLYEDKEPPEEKHHVASGSWLQAITAYHGRVQVLRGRVWWVIALMNMLVYLVFDYLAEHQEVENEDPTGFVGEVRDNVFSPLRLMSVGLMFLLIFRTQAAYEKWSLARQSWRLVTIACRDISMTVASYCQDPDAVCIICRYLLLFVISLRCWLRQKDMPEFLIDGLATPNFRRKLSKADVSTHGDGVSPVRARIANDRGLSFHFRNTCYPLMMLEVIRATVDSLTEAKTMGMFHGVIEQNLKALNLAMADMERVQDTELPFAYIVHIRTAIVLFFVVSPFFLVNQAGWFGLSFSIVFSYVLFGLENLAEELSNPFGEDSNDLPIDGYMCTIARDVSDVLQRFVQRRKQVEGTVLPTFSSKPFSEGESEREGSKKSM